MPKLLGSKHMEIVGKIDKKSARDQCVYTYGVSHDHMGWVSRW